ACGPNGFWREFAGNGDDPLIEIRCNYVPAGDVELQIMNHGDKAHTLHIRDHAYRSGDRAKTVAAGAKASIILNLSRSHGWYDFSVKVG
ncbi:DUF756 domain-containing protein, partial [Escherichia coli]|nr:DUF756 domain-containing protein [Escherichia coli]